MEKLDNSTHCLLKPDAEKCLPLALQHLSLLVLVENLSSYPVELLASLPLWLRRRLLRNLPPLDLCTLDSTAVALGIDVDEIWKWQHHHLICYNNNKTILKEQPFNAVHDMSALVAHEPRLVAIKQQKLGNWRERFLLTITHYILRFGGLPQAGLSLLATRGHQLLQNLAVVDDELIDEEIVQTVFMKQEHALCNCRGDSLYLIPKRLMTVQSNADQNQLLSLLTQSCGLQPSYLHLDGMLCCALPSLCNSCEGVATGLRQLLRALVMLKLSKIQKNVLRQIFEGVVGDGKHCKLLALSLSDFCVHREEFECLSPYLLTLPSDCCPPNYQGLTSLQLCHALHPSSLPYLTSLLKQQQSLKVLIIHGFFPWPVPSQTANFLSTLSSLFSRVAFQSLHLKWPNISSCQTVQIVSGFMSARCQDMQELMIAQQGCPLALEQSMLATVSVRGKTVPDCGVEHKIIQFTDSLMHEVLKLHTIRLKELVLDCEKNQQHFAAIHPDLRVMKLKLNFFNKQPDLASLTDDIRSLFQMSTLTEVTLDGPWTEMREAKKGLLLGLKEQSTVGSLRTITLMTSNDSESGYNQQEFKELWDHLFSLQHLEMLEVVLGERLSQKVKEMEQVLYKSWEQFASGKKLRRIDLSICTSKSVKDCLHSLAHIVCNVSTQCINSPL